MSDSSSELAAVIPRTQAEFRDTRVLAAWSIRFLLVRIGVELLSLPFLIMNIGDWLRWEAGQELDGARYWRHENATLNLSLVSLFFSIVGGILFLIWMYRSYRNLYALGVGGLQYSAVWAVVGWFIPIFHLFRPYQVMREIWKASDLTGDVQKPEARLAAPPSGLLKYWWAASLLSEFTAYVYVGYEISTFWLDNHLTAARLELAIYPFSIVAMILLLLVIQDVTARQAARHARRLALAIDNSEV